VTLRAFGPGRVNLIGEHTDYNGGLALPFAIERGVSVTAAPAADGTVRVRATDLGEEDAFDAAAPARDGADGWRAFPRGVVAELAALGVPLPGGAALTIESDLPIGAGLSSSAALSAALALAVLGLARAEVPDPLALARLCSRVEHEWTGAETGLLDQLAVLHGAEQTALRIDFATLAVEPVTLRLGGWTLAVLDSGAPHANAGSASGYTARRAECRAAAAALGIEHLAHADPAAAARLPEPLRRRARHVLTEDARVEATLTALDAGDLRAVGALLAASHASLRDDYEASVPAVEAAVGRMLAAGAAGARMVGGGFGGAVLGLFPPDAAPPAGAVPVAPAAGARLLGPLPDAG
jgi:galactokinase